MLFFLGVRVFSIGRGELGGADGRWYHLWEGHHSVGFLAQNLKVIRLQVGEGILDVGGQQSHEYVHKQEAWI